MDDITPEALSALTFREAMPARPVAPHRGGAAKASVVSTLPALVAQDAGHRRPTWATVRLCRASVERRLSRRVRGDIKGTSSQHGGPN